MLQKADDFIDELYAKYYRFLLNLCRKQTSYQPIYADLIEECIQDTFMQAYLSQGKLQSHPCLQAWLARTCMNRLIPRAQQQRRHQAVEAYSLDDDRQVVPEPQVHSIEDHLDEQEYHSFHHALVAALSDQEGMIYQQFFEQHHTMRQIANCIGLTENQVRYAIRCIRDKARVIKKSFD